MSGAHGKSSRGECETVAVKAVEAQETEGTGNMDVFQERLGAVARASKD